MGGKLEAIRNLNVKYKQCHLYLAFDFVGNSQGPYLQHLGPSYPADVSTLTPGTLQPGETHLARTMHNTTILPELQTSGLNKQLSTSRTRYLKLKL